MSHGYAINRRAPTKTSIAPPSAAETSLLADEEPVSSDGTSIVPFAP
ncbi:1167_t:CDS:2 [Entrophospora sp. SA101]|nr:3280_t:CDS:2 [Entrophospora sp. SA101]CAJ0650396.1 11362_t:CDS:2 [Entrophospora sp. SA101]CAJ0746063.1 1167_t:CDS:2 [Entrophospora sp. SA101]CAJ0832871.1 7888_t:CDS:2 [Entrophospora sp. SA101]CAJ0869840.1 12318_t:CDS:2 [Entrophospora sp. SA101]